eukprot:Opistho-1_new@10925
MECVHLRRLVEPLTPITESFKCLDCGLFLGEQSCEILRPQGSAACPHSHYVPVELDTEERTICKRCGLVLRRVLYGDGLRGQVREYYSPVLVGDAEYRRDSTASTESNVSGLSVMTGLSAISGASVLTDGSGASARDAARVPELSRSDSIGEERAGASEKGAGSKQRRSSGGRASKEQRRPYRVYRCECHPNGKVWREPCMFVRHRQHTHPTFPYDAYEDVTADVPAVVSRKALEELYEVQRRSKKSNPSSRRTSTDLHPSKQGATDGMGVAGAVGMVVPTSPTFVSMVPPAAMTRARAPATAKQSSRPHVPIVPAVPAGFAPDYRAAQATQRTIAPVPADAKAAQQRTAAGGAQATRGVARDGQTLDALAELACIVRQTEADEPRQKARRRKVAARADDATAVAQQAERRDSKGAEGVALVAPAPVAVQMTAPVPLMGVLQWPMGLKGGPSSLGFPIATLKN